MSLHIEDEEVPVIKAVNRMLAEAIRLQASDIHLEPDDPRALLRYRVDGVLHDFPPPPADLFRAIVARIKILSGMDIAERRLPQDGRAHLQIENKACDFRVSVIPNIHGEGVVMRVLNIGEPMRELDQLGFGQVLDRYAKLIRKPYGIILVTGPTGAGKSTTLYASLRSVFTRKKKIVTLEDPVEYEFSGITQIQIHSEIGYSFARGLRAVLRHDPDIIMLGEIRDLDSAEIAIRCSLTGHLVFSTLHTNDSISAVTRLVDIGIEPFMLFASLIGVLAQRLLRRLCPHCKTATALTPGEIASLLGIREMPAGAQVYEPAGCGHCNTLGYRGRLAVGELFEVTAEMRRLPLEKITTSALRAMAEAQGLATLRSSALDALYSGITSLEEVLNLTDTET